MTRIKQGPWTRIRPLQRDELDPYTQAGMMTESLPGEEILTIFAR